MTSSTVDRPSAAAEALQAVLDDARAAARAAGLPFAGSLAPRDAWALIEGGAATLVDVRSAEEHHFVGQVPAGLHVAWATGTSLVRNPRFVKELQAKASGGKPVLLLCRSGKRSAAAAEAATRAGLADVFNVREGFEGDPDAARQRGHVNGWRFHGLPWVQD